MNTGNPALDRLQDTIEPNKPNLDYEITAKTFTISADCFCDEKRRSTQRVKIVLFADGTWRLIE